MPDSASFPTGAIDVASGVPTGSCSEAKDVPRCSRVREAVTSQVVSTISDAAK